MAETLRRVLNLGSAAGPGKNTAEAEPPLLLLGGPGSGKTALLFAAALEAAGEGRGPVSEGERIGGFILGGCL